MADDARKWSLVGAKPRISVARRDSMIELSFLRAFLAWETFLEEACILYMLGQQPLRGRPLVRFVQPPTRPAAEKLAADGRDYANWNTATVVAARAERFFLNGRPFGILRTKQNALENAKKIRNAVAHDSESAQTKFKTVVRGELNAVPPGVTVGGFLNRVKPATVPPRSFLDYYLDTLADTVSGIARP